MPILHTRYWLCTYTAPKHSKRTTRKCVKTSFAFVGMITVDVVAAVVAVVVVVAVMDDSRQCLVPRSPWLLYRAYYLARMCTRRSPSSLISSLLFLACHHPTTTTATTRLQLTRIHALGAIIGHVGGDDVHRCAVVPRRGIGYRFLATGAAILLCSR